MKTLTRGRKPGRTKAPKMEKTEHLRDFKLQHEGRTWIVEIAVWRQVLDPGKGELRVYRIEGDVTNRALLNEALQAEADTRGLAIALEK